MDSEKKENKEINKLSMLIVAVVVLAEIKEWALNDLTVEEELKTLAEKTEREKYEIDETLKSKAFKLGTKLTRKKDRIIL